ncbi:vacuolar atp synthase subunit [Phaffia rhodozyma]|uniref:Vacuolar atp synthase subunit n=1 Tax=Phaffia rhodozyma TaxID=264483 RepID=A0A0F7SPH2_PHARH|nr:vacuolar atp synthase subunit [Phaffia rhodozyma]
MSGYLVVVIALIAAALGSGSWFVIPKGPNQTLIRTSILLALTSCYLMWGITYLSQLHPLLSPRRADLRPAYQE